MRRLVWIVVLAALLWSGWWFVASSGLRGGFETWLAERSAEGWQAEASEIAGGGFPLSLRADIRNLALADPETGLAVQTDHLRISAPAWWPGHATLALDDGPIAIASPFGRSDLTMARSVMAARLAPGTRLEVQDLGWTAGAWVVRDASGVQAQGDDLTLTMTQTEGPTYHFDASASGFAPGSAARLGLRLPDTFPEAFDSLQMQAEVTFDRPWDRRALAERRPQPRLIKLTLAEARWGDLSINLAADLVVAEDGTPEGTMALQAENWQTMLDIAQGTGALPAGLRDQAEGVLAALARASGNETTLDVDLTLRNGLVLFGIFPVGQAPRLILR